MNAYYVHAFFVVLGFLLMVMGFIIVRFLRSRRWWLKVHKIVNISGTVSLLLGIFVIMFYKIHFGLKLLSSIHSYLGLFIGFISIGSLIFGLLLVRLYQNRKLLLTFHRLLGRTLLILMVVNIISGLIKSGIVTL
ncbi:MAG: hypothetical protein N2596_05015 [Syntrophorhabdaceae bacterium]|nr:hypothetical protein [Syntrophorhabdaceae bacterium]